MDCSVNVNLKYSPTQNLLFSLFSFFSVSLKKKHETKKTDSQWGESRGSSREEMISFYDSEGNVPLHSAVHGGDIKVAQNINVK